MTDTTPADRQDDSTDPDYTQLGEDGNPFSGQTAQDAGLDAVPAEQTDDDAQNAPLPDGGPTDGSHGVDGED